MNRQFTRPAPDQLQVTDITEHPTREGKVYCAVVLDTCTRRVVGWPIRSSLHVADRHPRRHRHEHQRRLDVAKVTAGYTSKAADATANNSGTRYGTAPGEGSTGRTVGAQPLSSRTESGLSELRLPTSDSRPTPRRSLLGGSARGYQELFVPLANPVTALQVGGRAVCLCAVSAGRMSSPAAGRTSGRAFCVLQQTLQFLDDQAGVRKNSAQRSLGHIATLMYRDSGTAATRATLNPAFSNARTTRSPRTDGTGGIRPRQPSGSACPGRQTQRPGLRVPRASPRPSLGGIAFAVSPHARTQLRVSAPDAVFVLLDGVRDVHSPGHRRRLLPKRLPQS